ncbi:Hint domain-containing protein [Thalassovita sp.]|uniref:Hint domain-containing protein n=1 Tax=Thalassovita sp. TaxID=1979401 RepID=UPI0029DE70E7|nr:Hint domain-containing protein [Thalassovita sp.]
MASFVSYGIDVVGSPTIGTLSGSGQDGAGQVTLDGGSQVFGDTQIVEVLVEDVTLDGEVTGASRIVGLRVYDSLADYQSGTVLYAYEPMNPGQYANVQDDLSGIGDTYIRFNANVLVSSDPDAPSLNSLFIAPGTDAVDNIGSLTLDRSSDVDFNDDGAIASGTVEEGNTYFNIGYPEAVYSFPDGLVSGTDAGDAMGLGYVDPADGDSITTGADSIAGGAGNDTIDGDAGADTIDAGAGDDVVRLTDGFGNDKIVGGETGESDGDTLDASAVSADLVVDLSGAAEAGTVSDAGSTATFQEIEAVVLGSGNDTVILGDGGGDRLVGGFAAPTDNGDGTFSGNDLLDVSGLTDGSGAPVTTDSVRVAGDESGNAVLTFPGGEILTLQGVDPSSIGTKAALVAMGIPAGARDFIVEGGAGDDWIDEHYNDDPEGDRVDAGDALDGSDDDHIQAGDGNDTVLGGLGNDLIEGGTGDDRLEGGAGDDTFLGGEGADHIYGNEGNDVGWGGAGNDSFEGYDGDDYFDGGDGDDRIEGDKGNDTLLGGAGNDWMRGSFGNDYMEGGTGDDYIWSGYNDDTIVIEDNFGNDTIEMENEAEIVGDTLDLSRVTADLTIDLGSNVSGVGTFSDGVSTANFEGVEHLILGSGTNTIRLALASGNDAVVGFTAPTDNGDGTFTGHDQLDTAAMQDEDGGILDTADVTVGEDSAGNAVLSFPTGETLTLVGVSPDAVASPAQLHAIGIPLANTPDGIVEGTAGNDLIDIAYTGDPQGDMVDGADGDNDLIHAGDGDDTVLAGAGDDTVSGGAGNDQLDGGDGADLVCGDAGDDVIYVGDGDTVHGGSGDDLFIAGATGGGSGTVTGGETGETDGDVLLVHGPATIAYDPTDAESGTVTWDDGSTLQFNEIETVKYVPCFTPTTLIKTQRGEVPAGLLREGDRVLTRDNGFQQIRWTGQRALTAAELDAAPNLRPVLIRKDALGIGVPERDTMVSPQHRMLISGADTALWFGEPEVFVPASALLQRAGIRTPRAPGVTYVHFMFDRHQVVMGDGAWSESFQPGDMTLAGMDAQQRGELFTLFPDLARDTPTTESYPAARVTLSAQEALVLSR